MDRFGNILLIHSEVPSFETALARAIFLAKRDAAYLTIIEAAPNPAGGLRTGLNPFSSVSVRNDEARRTDRKHSLTQAVSRAQIAGVAARAVTIKGPPHAEILRHVINHGNDLVIVADGPGTGFQNVLGQSLPARLLRLCPCPVWIMKPHADTRIRRVVAAVAAGDAVGIPDEVDHAVLAFAAHIARADDCKLDVVHAWDFKGRDLETSRSELIPPLYNALYQRNHSAHAKSLDETLSQIDLDGLDHDVYMVKGDPFDVLLDFSDNNAVDLIVAGTISRMGLARLAHGNMVERLRSLVGCSIAAIKPADFIPALELASSPSRASRRPLPSPIAPR